MTLRDRALQYFAPSRISGQHYGTGSFRILHRLALVWRPVEAPNGVLRRVRSMPTEASNVVNS